MGSHNHPNHYRYTSSSAIWHWPADYHSIVLRVFSTELALTNQRIIAKTGLIRRNTVELRLEKVESLGIHQGIIGRIFNYGSVVVRGTGGTNTPIPNIKDPMKFRSIVNNHIEEMESKDKQ